MSQRGEQCGVSEFTIFGTSFDLHFHEAAVRLFDHRVYGVIIYEWQIYIEALFQHEANNIILNALPEC